MKLKHVLKKFAKRVFTEVVPLGGPIIDTISAIAGTGGAVDAKTATCEDVERLIYSVPEDQRNAILEKDYELKIVEVQEGNETLRAMLHADAIAPHTTRPKIAYQSFLVVGSSTVLVISSFVYAVLIKDQKLVSSIMDGWPFVVSILAPFVMVLRAYFGVLKEEQANKLNAGNGNPIGETISGLRKLLRLSN